MPSDPKTSDAVRFWIFLSPLKEKMLSSNFLSMILLFWGVFKSPLLRSIFAASTYSFLFGISYLSKTDKTLEISSRL